MKTTVIHHSADMDGLFCREIAHKFLPGAELVGWDFADKPLTIPEGQIYILDLPVDRVFGCTFKDGDLFKDGTPFYFPKECKPDWSHIVWIDHHKSSIETHPTDIPGYRIDGVAACRLAWQWFTGARRYQGQTTTEPPDMSWFERHWPRPSKEDFIDRKVSEPLAVRLAGEYDIWDKRDPRAEVFQFGLRSRELTPEHWKNLLTDPLACRGTYAPELVDDLVRDGELLQRYQQRNDASMMHRGFLVGFEGLTFLALNTARCNSLTFAAKDVPETGHDALMGFYYNGIKWTVSLYHAKHRTDLDLSKIAVKHGGGGHKGACGFPADKLPFLPC